jgi:hypothetical protein
MTVTRRQQRDNRRSHCNHDVWSARMWAVAKILTAITALVGAVTALVAMLPR